jgi:serine/threonine protein phosphatase 1
LADGRTIAVGDIHGYLAALRAVLAAIAPQPADTIVTLGDYVDRGPDSRGVIDELLALRSRCRLVPLLGNHDEMLLAICTGYVELIERWLLFGGDTTMASYGGRVPEGVPDEHIAFLKGCASWYETPRLFFVHGSYRADLPLQQQPIELLRWGTLKYGLPGPHYSGKTAIVGHTAQKDGRVLDLGYLRCIDTCCYGDGWLTAMDVDNGELWQADKQGRLL